MMSSGASHYMYSAHTIWHSVLEQALCCKTKMYRKIMIEFVESGKKYLHDLFFFQYCHFFCRDERVKVKQTLCKVPSHSHHASPGRIESQYYVLTSLQVCQDISDNQNKMIQSYFKTFFMVFIKTRTRQIYFSFIICGICSRDKMKRAKMSVTNDQILRQI